MDQFVSDGTTQLPGLAMLEAAWPVLTQVVEHPGWRAELAVADAVCDCYAYSLLAVKAAAAALVPGM
eukprot:1568852-Pyramimonas_sp.AAC.1